MTFYLAIDTSKMNQVFTLKNESFEVCFCMAIIDCVINLIGQTNKKPRKYAAQSSGCSPEKQFLSIDKLQ